MNMDTEGSRDNRSGRPWREKFHRVLSGMLISIHTALHQGRFKRWGKGSRVEPGMVVTCPWAIDVGNGVTIEKHATLNVKDYRTDGRATLIIGDGTHIGRFAHINAWHDVIIEDHVLITHRVTLGDEEHVYEDTRTPICMQGSRGKGRVLLKSGCFIGSGAIILPGVVIGRNAVVAANAVVSKDVPDCAVAAGVPARVIRYLDRAEDKQE